MSVSLAAATTEVEEGDGRLPWGVLAEVQQQPPPKLKKTSMADPLGGAVGISGSNHHRS
jgi:hypothetical protein